MLHEFSAEARKRISDWFRVNLTLRRVLVRIPNWIGLGALTAILVGAYVLPLAHYTIGFCNPSVSAQCQTLDTTQPLSRVVQQSENSPALFPYFTLSSGFGLVQLAVIAGYIYTLTDTFTRWNRVRAWRSFAPIPPAMAGGGVYWLSTAFFESISEVFTGKGPVPRIPPFYGSGMQVMVWSIVVLAMVAFWMFFVPREHWEKR
jgi:hypothetical protein